MTAGAARGWCDWDWRRGAATAGLAAVLAAWIGGILLGGLGAPAALWLALGAALLAPAVVWAARGRAAAARHWSLLALVGLSAAWSVLRDRHVSADHIAAFLAAGRQIVRVTGTVPVDPEIRGPQGGAFARFSHEAPYTVAMLDVDGIEIGGQWRCCRGQLLLRIGEADHRLRRGDRLEASGWLSPIEGPLNPGEPDFRRIFRQLEIDGRLFLPTTANWRLTTPRPGEPGGWRALVAEAAAVSLRLGLEEHPRRMALLDTVLLGRRNPDSIELNESFRQVGLAHVLSISGAHLAILIGLVWVLVGMLLGRPRVSALCVLAVLAVLMAIVPWRVPIVRSAIMASIFAAGYGFGRRAPPMRLLLLAALVVLLWRPAELFAAGFQLSFGAVGALLLFSADATQRCQMLIPAAIRSWPGLRQAAGLFAVNVVAFLAMLPLIAYHFQLITPWAPLVGVAAVPLITAALGLGYLKVFAGLLLPTLGRLLAAPLALAADLLLALVDWSIDWPGSALELQRPPPVAWVLGATALAAAVLGGRFRGRPAALLGGTGLCAAWLVGAAWPAWVPGSDPAVALRLDSLAVADGSCHLLRIGGSARHARHTIMFDCGSQQHLDIATRTVLPALRRLGVTRIDTLFLSHADLDHCGGALDLVEHLAVRQVLVPVYLLREAEREEGSAASFLVEQLRARGLVVGVVGCGWVQVHGPVRLEALWPPPDLVEPSRNDTSIVLRVSVADRRLLLCGDIQQRAIAGLLERQTDLAAAVCELPHHGAYVDLSPPWLDAVRPRLVLQSCGHARLRVDRWPPLLEVRGIDRAITARDGMVSVEIDEAGGLRWSAFAGGGPAVEVR